RVAEARRQPVLAGRDRVRARGEAPARPGRPPNRIQLERPERREVDDDAPVAHAMPRRAVAAAADRELGPGLARMRDDPRNIVGTGDPGDERRTAIDVGGEEDRPRRVIPGIARGQDLALEGGEEHPRVPFLYVVQENVVTNLSAVQDGLRYADAYVS